MLDPTKQLASGGIIGRLSENEIQDIPRQLSLKGVGGVRYSTNATINSLVTQKQPLSIYFLDANEKRFLSWALIQCDVFRSLRYVKVHNRRDEIEILVQSRGRFYVRKSKSSNTKSSVPVDFQT